VREPLPHPTLLISAPRCPYEDCAGAGALLYLPTTNLSSANIILGLGPSAVASVPGPFPTSLPRSHQELSHPWGMKLK
jgi:hypothetical protein